MGGWWTTTAGLWTKTGGWWMTTDGLWITTSGRWTIISAYYVLLILRINQGPFDITPKETISVHNVIAVPDRCHVIIAFRFSVIASSACPPHVYSAMLVYILYIYLFISLVARELWGNLVRQHRPHKHYCQLWRITTDYIVIVIIAIMFITKGHYTLLGESLCVLMLLTFHIITTTAAVKNKYVAEGGKSILI